MQMNKFLKVFMMALCMVALSAAYVGCTPAEQQVTRLIIDDASILTVEQGTTLEEFEIVVKGMYPDSTEIAISKSDLTITGWDTATAGEKKLTISYTVPGTQTVLTLEDITLTVIKKIASVSYKAGSTETTVEKGSTLDYSNLKLLVTYEGETTPVEVAYNARTMQIALDTSTAGTKTMTITYMGKTATTQITVIELASIAFDPSSMSQTAYQYVPLSTAGASITATYSDNSTKTISTNLTFSGVNTQNAGVQNLVIGYKGLSTPNIAITVKEVTAIAYASGLADAINQGAILAKTGLKLTATYEGATKTLDYDMIANVVEFTGYDTSVAGDQTVTITLGSLVTTHDITVIMNNDDIIDYEAPAFLTSRTITQNTYTDYFNDATHVKGFAETNHMYVVGNQNPWKFLPVVHVDDGTDEGAISDKVHTTVKVYLGAQVANEALLEGDDLATYVTIDNYNYQTYDFTADAADQIFTIVVTPYGINDSIHTWTFTFRVINGYNIYDAKDLSILDNMDGASSDDHNTAGKWTEWRNANDVEFYNGITPNDVTAIVFQNNIDLHASDVPSVQFWDKDSKGGDLTLEQAIAQNINLSTYNYFKGSVKDRMNTYNYGNGDKYSEFVYTRKIDSGTFTIEGNYYRLSIENYPRVQYITADGSVFQGGDDPQNPGTPITTHATLFSFQGKDAPSEAMNCHFVMRDINLMGNAGRTENVQDSGGLLGIKKKNAEMTIENVLSQKWFINFMNDEGVSHESDYNSEKWGYANSLTLKKVNMFDSYNTLVYNWSGALNIEDCNLIGAGGPVMICDHVGNNETTAAGGTISKVNVKNSVLQSWVAGTEGWFVSYGATALATIIKATNYSYLSISDGTKSILRDKDGISLMNLIAVYKSAEVEGISESQIRGTFDVYGYSNGLDLENGPSKSLASIAQDIQLRKISAKIAAILVDLDTTFTADSIADAIMDAVATIKADGETDTVTILGNAVGTALAPKLQTAITNLADENAGGHEHVTMADVNDATLLIVGALTTSIIPNAIWTNILKSQINAAAQQIAGAGNTPTDAQKETAAALVKAKVFAAIQVAIMTQVYQGQIQTSIAAMADPTQQDIANVIKTVADTIIAALPDETFTNLGVSRADATNALYIELIKNVRAQQIKAAAQQIAGEGNTPTDANKLRATKIVVAEMLSYMLGVTLTENDVSLPDEIVNTGLTALVGAICTAGQAALTPEEIEELTIQSANTQAMQTYNGGFCQPGQDKVSFAFPNTEDALNAVKALFKAATGYTNIYLFNGMATVFGLNDVTA